MIANIYNLTLFTLMATLMTASTVHPQYRFEILDLNDLNETLVAVPYSINDNGVITGFSDLDNPDRTMATVWIDGRAIPLGIVPGDHASDAAATNLNGQTVGTSTLIRHVGNLIFFYSTATLFENGNVIELETLIQSGENWALLSAVDINDSGQIIGNGRDLDLEEGVSYIFQDGLLTELGTLGGYATIPYAINNMGQVVGQSWTSGGQNHAFIWENGDMTDLGTFGGRDSRALDINELGQAVGGSERTGGRERAVLWADGRSIDLGDLGGEQANANSINDRGQIVGFSTDVNWYAHMFFWADSVMINPLEYIPPGGGWGGRANAFNINNAGQFVGTAYRYFYDAPAVLTPVELELSELDPGMAGEMNRIDIMGLTPGEQVHVAYGGSAGMTKIPGCPGATILISEPRIAGTAVADPGGFAEVEVFVPEAAAGRTFRVQAVQQSECLESNVVTVTFR
jgi:probable HAF family extracellular repeat protein